MPRWLMVHDETYRYRLDVFLFCVSCRKRTRYNESRSCFEAATMLATISNTGYFEYKLKSFPFTTELKINFVTLRTMLTEMWMKCCWNGFINIYRLALIQVQLMVFSVKLLVRKRRETTHTHTKWKIKTQQISFQLAFYHSTELPFHSMMLLNPVLLKLYNLFVTLLSAGDFEMYIQYLITMELKYSNCDGKTFGKSVNSMVFQWVSYKKNTNTHLLYRKTRTDLLFSVASTLF